MSESETDIAADGNETPQAEKPNKSKALRRLLFAGAAVLILAVAAALIATFTYRLGYVDSYISSQVRNSLDQMGIAFTADTFNFAISPLELKIKNAVFNDKQTGEKLFSIRDANVSFTIPDLFAWSLRRNVNVDSTEINGAEIWLKFDENGRSNFSNIITETGESNLSVNYESSRLKLTDSVIHINDVTRKISADGNNISLSIDPEDLSVPDEQKRYKIDLTSTGSNVVYDESKLENVNVSVKAVADRAGADIADLRVETPIGHSYLSGRINDWSALNYDLNIESSVDLTQTSNSFPIGTTLRGVGNFKGKVSGSGENYKIEGNINSEALAADGVYLKAMNVDATVAGTNANYEANGTAVAELLTFEDFRIEFPKIAGNVRGTGTDFRWVGELQAAAAKTRSITLGGLFLSDAVAEMKDREVIATVGNGRVEKFSFADSYLSALRARDVAIKARTGGFELTAPGATAADFTTPDYKLQGVTSRSVSVKDQGTTTTVDVNGVTAEQATLKDARARNVKADSLSVTDTPDKTDVKLRNLTADNINASGAIISGASTPLLEIYDNPVDTKVYADRLRIAKITGGGATLGTLNIAGVRLSIREGRVEGTSQDIDAGSVTLEKSETLAEGGTLEDVKILKPVFVVEPSGRYRASADMSIGGGIVGNVPLGNANASVVVNSNGIEVNDLSAQVMDGNVAGKANIAFNERNASSVAASFSDLDLSKVIALQAGRMFPFEGKTNGTVDLQFNGTNIGTATGSVNADIAANAGNTDSGQIPVNGRIELLADQGIFNIQQAKLNTPQSSLSADGRFDLGGDDSNLNVSLNSNDATEVERLFRVLGISKTVEDQIDTYQIAAAGKLEFRGTLTGSFNEPNFNGSASLERLAIRGRGLGTLSSDIQYNSLGTQLNNGLLRETDGGNIAFNINIPTTGANNISVDAKLSDVNAGNLIAAIPFDLPDRLKDFNGKTSGSVDLEGLPNAARGSVDIASANGTVAGQQFDGLNVKAVFADTNIHVEKAEIRVGSGSISGTGHYDHQSRAFISQVRGNDVPLALMLSFLPESESIPVITGSVNLTASATGDADDPQTYDVNFTGKANNVVVNEYQIGSVDFNGLTKDRLLTANLSTVLDGRQQVFNAKVDFGQPEMPFLVEHTLDQSPLRPFFAFVPQLRGLSVSGTGTGRVEFGGNLTVADESGQRQFSTEALIGSVRFSQLSLVVQDSPLNAVEPVVVTFSTRGINFESVKLAGGGTNISLTGSKALAADAMNNLALDGRINLGLLNVIPGISAADTFFGGFADVSMRLAGDNVNARLTGTANIDNAAIATFIGSSRLTMDRLQGRVLFASNQAQIEQVTGYLGGGRFVASGGALFGDNLNLAAYRLSLNGTNITVPLPEDFTTTGDARLEISGRRIGQNLTSLIAGNILARRSIYTRDIDLANVVGSRGDGSLSSGPSTGFAPRFDLSIEGRDALVVRNNIADLTASVSLRLTGTTTNPQIAGRITANSGTVYFRKDRYVVQRGVLEFPPDTEIEPVIFLQAETEIQGYQIFVNLSGPLTDTQNLQATLRSSPALPDQDVVSLITTGSLANTGAGIPTLASTGINTAAEVLTDSIINNPARRATDKLFGLNVFEIDPIISGERINPSARLTVGRQINNNLRVTYATNLSQDQNQVLALEYRVSNRLSVVAQYEQRALSNVTKNRDNFSIEVRLRRRF